MTVTPEELDRIDAMVAQHVIGYGERVKPGRPGGPWIIADAFSVGVRQYTRDWAAMGEVITKMMPTIGHVYPQCDEETGRLMHWCAVVEKPGDRRGVVADTLPIAVALAALKAVGQEVTL